MLADETTPFVLLDDARDGGAPARLYRAPVRVVERARSRWCARRSTSCAPHARPGSHAAGFLSYEAGAALEPVLGEPVTGSAPLLWFGLFDDYREIAPGDVPALLPDPRARGLARPDHGIDRVDYDAQLARILELIAAGDIYQANLTFRAEVRLPGDPLALYALLRARARAGYGAMSTPAAKSCCRCRPNCSSRSTRAPDRRPMKGTARRGATREEDAAARRNASRRCQAARRESDDRRSDAQRSVARRQARQRRRTRRCSRSRAIRRSIRWCPPSPPTGGGPRCDRCARGDLSLRLDDRCAQDPGDAGDRRSRGESPPRGPYTGAIGWLDANGDAMFNVAIRTLVFEGSDVARSSALGSGVVADSSADEEWDECLRQGRVCDRGAGPLRPDRDDGASIPLRADAARTPSRADARRARTCSASPSIGMPRATSSRPRPSACARRAASAWCWRRAARSRSRSRRCRAPPAEPVKVAIVPLPVASGISGLRHKTSDRALLRRCAPRCGHGRDRVRRVPTAA